MIPESRKKFQVLHKIGATDLVRTDGYQPQGFGAVFFMCLCLQRAQRELKSLFCRHSIKYGAPPWSGRVNCQQVTEVHFVEQ